MGIEFSIHDQIWFTADSHFGHENIIKYCNRPFESVEEMDRELIEKWNERVGKRDYVFHLGDFTLGNEAQKYFEKLNGNIYVLCLGWHHDKRWNNGSLFKTKNGIVKWLFPIDVIYINDIRDRPFPITLSHYPMAEWEASHYHTWHLHGHSHGHHETDPMRPFALDVGVDCWDYYPVSLSRIHETMCELGWQK